jgi:hypothetical protein
MYYKRAIVWQLILPIACLKLMEADATAWKIEEGQPLILFTFCRESVKLA